MNPPALSCPLPLSGYERILLGHGSGGRLSADLLKQLFLPAFDNAILNGLGDQAVCHVGGAKLAFTTDSFVVHPPFFPGGDIGELAVYGTVNDLAVGGARPLFLSAAFILEEGLLMEDLRRLAESMRKACDRAGILLVTGDTKVVDRGKGDQIFITTAGIGIVPEERRLSIQSARPGDRIVISGTMGDHGMAIMSVREGLEFETELKSDLAPLHELAELALTQCRSVRCMRDPTRGGLAGAVNELAASSRAGVKLDESAIPIREDVQAACELLGLDPLYVANEGKLMAVVGEEEAEGLVQALRQHPLGQNAALIGRVVEEHPGLVTMRSIAGGERILSILTGEQLPRIC